MHSNTSVTVTFCTWIGMHIDVDFVVISDIISDTGFLFTMTGKVQILLGKPSIYLKAFLHFVNVTRW